MGEKHPQKIVTETPRLLARGSMRELSIQKGYPKALLLFSHKSGKAGNKAGMHSNGAGGSWQSAISAAPPLWKDVLPGSRVGKRRRRFALPAQAIGRVEWIGLMEFMGRGKHPTTNIEHPTSNKFGRTVVSLCALNYRGAAAGTVAVRGEIKNAAHWRARHCEEPTEQWFDYGLSLTR